MLWNWNSGPSETSAVAVSSPATFTRCRAASFISVGSALNPAVILHSFVSYHNNDSHWVL